MKKIIAALFGIIFLITIGILLRISRNQSTDSIESTANNTSSTKAEAESHPEIRAVWISYFELSMKNETCTESAFCKKARDMVNSIAENGLDTVFIHVRPASDAFYNSEIYPYSEYLTGTEGKNPGFDPLEIFCTYAAEQNLSVHAWINPFRICSNSAWKTRSQNNPAVSLSQDKNNIVFLSQGVYYNPASTAVHNLILSGVRELLTNYSIDGIHMDDYFYPTTDAAFDSESYNDYLINGGNKSLPDFRRDNVNKLVQSIYSTVKSFGADKIFSISPGLDIEKNVNSLYADVRLWASESGYCDWLIPQLYVGFQHETAPFSNILSEWKALANNPDVKMIIGLSPYKCGVSDSLAGNGQNEWIDNNNILQRQLIEIRNASTFGGFALYSYSYLFGPNSNKHSIEEFAGLKSILN